MNKSEQIKHTLLETKLRRANQRCRVFTVKVDKSELSKNTKKHLDMLFIEAKWIYNYCLDQDIFNIKETRDIKVLNKDKVKESRQIKHLSSQMVQACYDSVKQNILNLNKAKKKGLKVGRLKFKSNIDSINLKQFNCTYKIHKNRIKLQGIKKPIRVNGLSQIPIDCEFANAKIIKKNDNYYFDITTYSELDKPNKNLPSIGIDFGIKDTLVFSNGVKIKTKFDYSKIKKEQRKLSKKKLHSKNYNKQKLKLNKQYGKLHNQKKDVIKKIISYLKHNFSLIAIQNENIKGWQKGLFGKQVQQSILGKMLSEFKKLDITKVVDRYVPTTKLCYNCGKINKLKLSDRIYICECGLKEDRDIKSAKTILKTAMEHSIEPVEKEASERMFRYFLKLYFVEAGSPSL